ncbi:MAG: hypothetical protein ISR74_06400 [Candidatus Thioglobus sp.]|nr:hypothetical protein [Candidatus Thioglobus sp.]
MIYNKLVQLLDAVFEELPEGIDLSKGGVGEIALAHHLGHEIIKGDKGADAMDEDGNKYEYKISTTDQFNFHFGARNDNPGAVVTKHFDGIAGAFCAKRVGMKITDVVFVPSSVLVPALIKHFNGTIGGQLNKNYRLNSFSALKNP